MIAKLESYPEKQEVKKFFEEEYFNGEYSNYGGGYPRLQLLFEPWAESIIQRFDLKDRKMLEVGCATGSFVLFMEKRGVDAFGTDISRWAIKNRVANKLFLSDAEHLPIKSETFDCITAFELIEHLPNPVAFIKEAHRILKKSGLLLVTTPNLKSRPEKDLDVTHISLKPHNEWRRIIKENGFSLLREIAVKKRPRGRILKRLPFSGIWIQLFSKKVSVIPLVFKKV